jgi:hypothetical protein
MEMDLVSFLYFQHLFENSMSYIGYFQLKFSWQNGHRKLPWWASKVEKIDEILLFLQRNWDFIKKCKFD